MPPQIRTMAPEKPKGILSRYPGRFILNPNIDAITDGVVFFHSSWSGYSTMYFKPLMDTLERHPSIPLFVIQAGSDILPAFETHHGVRNQGYGETFWLKDGQILHSITGRRPEGGSSIQQYSQMLAEALEA